MKICLHKENKFQLDFFVQNNTQYEYRKSSFFSVKTNIQKGKIQIQLVFSVTANKKRSYNKISIAVLLLQRLSSILNVLSPVLNISEKSS